MIKFTGAFAAYFILYSIEKCLPYNAIKIQELEIRVFFINQRMNRRHLLPVSGRPIVRHRLVSLILAEAV